MADEEELEEEVGEEGEAPKKGGNTMKIVIIVNAVVLLLALIGGGAWFFMSGDDSAAGNDQDTEVLAGDDGEGDEGGGGEVRTGTPIYVPLHPAFVVNFENQEKVSFLQVDIQIMTFDRQVEQAIKTHMPIVRNELLLLLGGKQYHEINTREGKRNLSQEAIREMQRVLQEAGAPSEIEALYFTSFVMQ